VRNAIDCNDRFGDWNAASAEDFLAAHGIMMRALVDDAGLFRRSGVGIYRGSQLVHMAPPAERVEHLVRDLFRWLEATEHHPLVASSILHYEIEFIHPFADGNGRMGRLWQSLALASWHADLAYLPVESLISERQADY
jgi:Fic family protein